jgi:hypothetical protein
MFVYYEHLHPAAGIFASAVAFVFRGHPNITVRNEKATMDNNQRAFQNGASRATF